MTKFLFALALFAFSLGNGVAQTTGMLDLVGKLSITNLPVHDVWGYTDMATNTRYALLGASNSGMRVIDVSDPADPQMVGTISGGGVHAIDIKTWQNYAYVVGESLNLSGKVIDLSDPSNPVQVGTFPGGHNIFITEQGYMYLATPGVRIFDLNADPTSPTLVFNDSSCNGHDISVIDNRLYDFSDNCGTRIFDISQPDTLVEIGSVPSSGIFHHSGWPSSNGNHLLVCDELASPTENDITVWDISDLQNTFLVDSFMDPSSYVHNTYVIGNYAFTSFYRAGFRVFDVTDPSAIDMIAEYDTDSTLSGPGYGGNFGVYPFWGPDTILVSDEENGLYIFSFSVTTGITDEDNELSTMRIFPNPTTDLVTLELPTTKGQIIELKVLNAEGRTIFQENVVRNGALIKHTFSLAHLPNGLYLVSARTENAIRTKRILLNK